MAMRHCRRGKDVIQLYVDVCERDSLSVSPNSVHVHFKVYTTLVNIKENSPLIP